MIKRKLRLIVLLLTTALLLSAGTLAADEPSFWATEAVAFAVDQGIFSADNVRPQEPATRAELASMLTRLFRAERMADLSEIQDISSANWYYEPMAKAVAMGLFQGSEGKLRPGATISREQAMTVLARAFGVADGKVASLAQFQDRAAVSPWAVPAVAALVEGGSVTGSSGRLNPKSQITRQDLAVLLQKLSGTVVLDGAIPEEGDVLWADGQTLPRNVTIAGDLYLAPGTQETITLQGVNVKGRLVLHGGNVELSGTTNASEIVLCGEDITLKMSTAAPVRVTGGRASISGSGTLHAQAPVTLTGGSWKETTVSAATLTVKKGATVDNATLSKKDSHVTGDGTVKTAVVLQKNCTIDTPETVIENRIDAGVEQVVITPTVKANEAKPTAPTVKTTVQFTNVDVTNCLGAENGVRLCTLLWYVDGVLTQKTADFALTEGATASFSGTLSYKGVVAKTATIQVVLTYGDESVSLSQLVNQHPELLASAIKTIHVEATTRRATSLYQNSSLSGWIANLPAGTTGIYYNYAGTYAGKIRLSDGRTGWVRWSDLSISTKNYVELTDYTTDQKVNFVNNKDYKSKTKYLVWISLLKEKINVFTGEAGAWSLVKSFPCSSGKNTTPTIGGVFKYQYRSDNWDFGYYYVKRPMIFNGGHAFHTRTYIKSSGGLLDASMQKTVSAGCIRMYDADVNWLWDNMPFGTTVVVY